MKQKRIKLYKKLYNAKRIARNIKKVWLPVSDTLIQVKATQHPTEFGYGILLIFPNVSAWVCVGDNYSQCAANKLIKKRKRNK